MPPASSVPSGRQAREQFVSFIEGVLPALSDAIRLKLIEQLDGGTGSRAMHERRDAMLDFERLRAGWVKSTAKAWHDAVVPPTATARVRLATMDLQLIGDDVVERKILASRLAPAVREKASWELNDLKTRMQHLEGVEELANQDILQPEAVSQLLIEQWTANTLSHSSWSLAKDVIQQHMVDRMLEGYRHANKFLVDRGVLPEIDLTRKVKRGVSAPGTRRANGEQGGGNSDYGGLGSHSNYGDAGAAPGPAVGQASSNSSPRTQPGDATRGVGEETRMMTSGTPLARARQRANGVLGQLRRLLTDRVAGFDINHVTRPSPALDEAMSIHQTAVQITVAGTGAASIGGAPGATGETGVVYDEARVGQVATELRQRSGDLKKKAATSTEKATIEIVALMFQSILAEERIPPAIRVWFARL